MVRVVHGLSEPLDGPFRIAGVAPVGEPPGNLLCEYLHVSASHII